MADRCARSRLNKNRRAILANSLHPEYNPLIRKLDSIFTLTDDERQALETLPMQVVVIKENQDIVREGDVPPGPACS